MRTLLRFFRPLREEDRQGLCCFGFVLLWLLAALAVSRLR